MRFSSFLPMLLLVGAFKAYGQCSITDLTATASPFANASCEYFVTLDFQFSGTTNQYTVTGNGNNYGTFTYDSVPVVLGPFTAGNDPALLEFVVTDAVFGDCMDATALQVPACPNNAACDIYDVNVVTGNCNPGSISYQLLLDFKVDNPGNDFFEVWSGAGIYLGSYPLNQLPLPLPVYPWNGDSIDQIKICINDNPNCCEIIDFPAPDCVLQPCNITGLEAVTGDCTSDSTYQLKLNFSLLAPNLLNQFGVFANGEFLGIFGFDDLPITIDNYPWNGGRHRRGQGMHRQFRRPDHADHLLCIGGIRCARLPAQISLCHQGLCCGNRHLLIRQHLWALGEFHGYGFHGCRLLPGVGQ